MALFTESQANACVITKVKKIVSGSDCSWGLGVKDTDGNHYHWINSSLASDASKSDIKVAVKAKLLELKKQSIITPITATMFEESDNKGLGETLG